MSETLLMSLLMTLTLQVAAGQYRLICQTPPIKAAAGDRALIECHVDPPVHLKTKTVEFSKVDPYEVLLVHRSGEVDPDQSSSRISLSDEDLKSGIVRLQISPVQLSDSGLYKIRIPPLKTHCTFDLSVAEKENLKQNRINTQDVNTIPETKPKKPDENHVGAIAGGILGAIVLTGLIVVLVRRRKKIWRKIRG